MMLDDRTGIYRHCLLTDDCLFILFISRKEIRLRMLPTPDLRLIGSSLTILCVFGRALGLLGTTAPALRVKSDRNESRWEANFFKAFSKSVSLSRRPLPLIWEPLIVVLLRLLSVPFLSGERDKDVMDKRASSERFDRRWYEFLLDFLGVAPFRSGESPSASAALSSSIVGSTGAVGATSVGSSSFLQRS